MDVSSREKPERLANRIRAHRLFANFDVADWLRTFLDDHRPHDIFDLGCGDGNHLGLYLDAVGPVGSVTGLDRQADLIAAARARYGKSENLRLTVGSMDARLPYDDGAFDLCFSNFAIYNAKEPRATLVELRRVMKPGSELVLIGPTSNNARELYEFNRRLTGETIDETALIRTDRLGREIAPIARTLFANVREEVINSELTFPDVDEFLRYFCSTTLYERGAEQSGVTKEQMYAVCSPGPIVLSKEMLAVVATAK